MLDGLDAIDWSSLQDAYGEASEVPDMIRGLASSKSAAREDALEELENQVCHEGSVSEASPHVVPFLIELLGEPSVGGKAGILLLLSDLAAAGSDQEGLLREPGPFAEAMRGKPDFAERLRRERGWVEATRRAVEAGLPLYFRLLRDAAEGLRLPAANLLCSVDAEKPRLAAALREAFAGEARNGLRCGLLLLLGSVGGPGDESFLREAFARASGSPPAAVGDDGGMNHPLRWGAAVALVRLLGNQAPAEAVDVLTEVIQAGPSRGGDWDGLPESLHESVRGAVLTLAHLRSDDAVRLIGRSLDRVDPEDLWDVMDILVGVAFPAGDEAPGLPAPRASTDLTTAQRAALTALADSDAAWKAKRVIESMLEDLGLPMSREGLRGYLSGG